MRDFLVSNLGATLIGVLFAFKRVDGYAIFPFLLILDGAVQPFPSKSKFLATHQQNETYPNNSNRCITTGGVRLN